MVTKTLKYYHKLFDESVFHRIHGSHLINLKHIVKYYKEGTVEMSDGSTVFVSARKKKGFLDKLQEAKWCEMWDVRCEMWDVKIYIIK